MIIVLYTIHINSLFLYTIPLSSTTIIYTYYIHWIGQWVEKSPASCLPGNRCVNAVANKMGALTQHNAAVGPLKVSLRSPEKSHSAYVTAKNIIHGG